MTTQNTSLNPVSMLALLLGQASMLWGLIFAPTYWLTFALLLPQGDHLGAAGPTLPVGLPLIGLAVAILAIPMTRWAYRPAVGFAVAGLVLNTLALALAALLRLLG